MKSDIHFKRQHQLDHQQAHHILEHVVASLDERYGVTPTWQGDTVNFQKQGIQGYMQLKPHEVEVSVNLGMLFKAFKPMIESELRKKMDKYFPE